MTEALVPNHPNVNQLYSWCNSMSANARQQKGYYPNEIFWPKNKDDRRVIVCSRKSPRGDFALNEAALLKAKASGLEAYVWLVETNGAVVARDTVENVLARFDGQTPWDGRHGRY